MRTAGQRGRRCGGAANDVLRSCNCEPSLESCVGWLEKGKRGRMQMSEGVDGKVKGNRGGRSGKGENCVSGSLKSKQVLLVLRRSDALNLSRPSTGSALVLASCENLTCQVGREMTATLGAFSARPRDGALQQIRARPVNSSLRWACFIEGVFVA
ncbi:hypothetical protein BU25DRAFT_213265 [Macroventuria anomochaeta]|uniref:Uncharacterized protein n=1 Tax=Macroventuria anomochaeta TaxID=301207 RepID=A0ACB6RMA8_9PLEO|nr:uncharacterized protein BU25DRAFT_213265 [Macroventuria anomochaeta]KAF2622238.1 hypothetical protein BU25DRAFT_213265 [Macroventuria anomochaeta]